MRNMLKGTAIVTVLMLSFALVIMPASNVEAAENASGKFGRGLVNILTGWLEVFHNIIQVSKDENPFLGITVGTIKGIGKTLARTGSGVFDVLTFYMAPYDEPLVEPDFAWSDDWSE
jgi:putative exosortase-associated protein (TIGR04073 family)